MGSYTGFISDIFSTGGTGSLESADELFKNLELPDYAKSEEELRKLLDTGKITPEEYQVAQQERSKLEDYRVDPRLKEAQMRALGGLEDVSRQGGLTSVDRARISDIQRRGASAERGSREAILQNAQARGVGGSGLELASQLSASQASADRNAQEGENVAARAEQRALDALQGAGDMGGRMRSQDFGEQERISQARDSINRFNAANRTDANRTNAGVRNAAALSNRDFGYAGQQDINDLRRKKFQDNYSIAQGRAGIANNLASMEEGRRNSGIQTTVGAGTAALSAFSDERIKDDVEAGGTDIDAFLSSLDKNKYVYEPPKKEGGGGGMGIAALAAFSDVNAKENIEAGEPDLEQFMKGLTVNKYDFKDPSKYGEGKHFGPMAQDLEKSEVGDSMVSENGEGVKMVDAGKAQMVTLAVLKELYDRMEALENAKA